MQNLTNRQLLDAVRASDNERDGLALLAELVRRFEAATARDESVAREPAPVSLDTTPRPVA